MQSGLGHRFIASVEQAILHIIEKPQQWKILEQDVRRYLTRVFPYAVLYTIEPDYILIIAVMHCHREILFMPCGVPWDKIRFNH
jgi:toxin ParE1/3/4